MPVTVLLMTASSASAQIVLHVSSRGSDDAGDGSVVSPLATLGRARDTIRAIKASGPLPPAGVVVQMAAGTYRLAEPLELTAEDSGSADAPIIYRAAPGEDVRLVGGRPVGTWRKLREGEVSEGLPEAALDHVLVADLPAEGVTDFGRITPRGFGRPGRPAPLELFVGGRRMTLARWPNAEWPERSRAVPRRGGAASAPSASPRAAGWARIAEVVGDRRGGRFRYDGDRPARWVDAPDAWLHGYWFRDWADGYDPVASIDPATHEIALGDPKAAPYGLRKGARWYALNLLEELDTPGEWYLDRESGRLYFWPPEGFDPDEAAVSALETLVSIHGARHVHMVGLTLEVCRGDAVQIEGGEDVRLLGCTIRGTGRWAVRISGGRRHRAVSCDVYDTGEGGVALSGGDREALTPAGHVVRNSHIHHFSRWCRTYRPAVRIAGVGSRVERSLIHDGPHAATIVDGNEHVIEGNEITRVCGETDDVGAVYMGRDWTERGNVVRHNFFHHVESASEVYRHGSRTVYLDDAASGTRVVGNVFYKAGSLCAVNIGGGRDNSVVNNVFVDCKNAVLVDARGLGWAKGHIAKGGGWRMYEKLAGVGHDRPPWSERYPRLARILEEDPAVPKGNVLARNIAVRTNFLALHGPMKREWLTLEANLTEGDPGFVAPDRMDFRLRDDSPALALGFGRIPPNEIGLYKDEYRQSLAGP